MELPAEDSGRSRRQSAETADGSNWGLKLSCCNKKIIEAANTSSQSYPTFCANPFSGHSNQDCKSWRLDPSGKLPSLSFLDLAEIFPRIAEAVNQRKSFETRDSSESESSGLNTSSDFDWRAVVTAHVKNFKSFSRS